MENFALAPRFQVGKFAGTSINASTVHLSQNGLDFLSVTVGPGPQSEHAKMLVLTPLLGALQAQAKLEKAGAALADKVSELLRQLPTGEVTGISDTLTSELQSLVRGMTETLHDSDPMFAQNFKLVMRNNVGEDSTIIKVYVGQDAAEVANRVAAGYGAKVVSVTPE